MKQKKKEKRREKEAIDEWVEDMDPTESMKHLPTLMKVYTNEPETPDEETRHCLS